MGAIIQFLLVLVFLLVFAALLAFPQALLAPLVVGAFIYGAFNGDFK